MKFEELKTLLESELGIERYADIARELGVTPQVVNNWKSRGHVPYKYVKVAKKKIDSKKKSDAIGSIDQTLPPYVVSGYQGNIEIDDEEDSLIHVAAELFKVVKSKYIYVLIVALITGAGSIIHDKFFAEPVYLSVCKLLPSSSGGASSGLSGLASSFGFNISSNKATSLFSSSMFPNVIKSRKLMRELLLEKFYSDQDDTTKTLLAILLKQDFSDEKISDGLIKYGIAVLDSKIKVSDLRDSPLMTISVMTNNSQLSVDLMTRLLSSFNNMLLEFKLSQIVDQKNFIINRIEEIGRDLKKAEEDLKLFRDQNRFIASSAALLLEEDRLDREVTVQTEIYINLKNQLELAKIEEVKEGMLFQILDEPEFLGKLGPKPFRNFFQRIILGILYTVIIILSLDWYGKNKTIFSK